MTHHYINVYISRFSNGYTLPRLYSSLHVDQCGPLENEHGFRFTVSPTLTKDQIINQCLHIKFDKRPEINALMFISSILIGWSYRVTISKEYYMINDVHLILFDMLHTLLQGDKDGWVTVRSYYPVTAKDYTNDILSKIIEKNDWRGIFDINLQLTTLAIASGNKKALKTIMNKFHTIMRSKKKNDRDINRFKLFNFLTSVSSCFY